MDNYTRCNRYSVLYRPPIPSFSGKEKKSLSRTPISSSICCGWRCFYFQATAALLNKMRQGSCVCEKKPIEYNGRDDKKDKNKYRLSLQEYLSDLIKESHQALLNSISVYIKLSCGSWCTAKLSSFFSVNLNFRVHEWHIRSNHVLTLKKFMINSK